MQTLTTYSTAATTDAAAITRLIKGMREMGWVTTRLNDGEVTRTVDSDENVASIVVDLTAVDESRLYWKKGEHKASMFFVMGNAPYEVLCDCSYFDAWNDDLKQVEEAINLEGVPA